MIMRADACQAPELLLGGQGVRMISIDTDNPEVYPASSVATGDRPAQMESRLVEDVLGKWFEVGFTALQPLTGDAATGYYGGRVRIDIEQSTDLVNWNEGQVSDCDPPAIDNMDGTCTYWARLNTPIYWKSIIVDLTATTNRYGKSITAIKIGGSTVSLPGYPYAMPSQAAVLQTDLIAAGYTGAVVSSVSASLGIDAINHNYSNNSYNRDNLPVTLSGSNVTLVKTTSNTDISLPGYPYSMPSQLATLQADLRTAGQSGAVVRLYGDAWTIFLPNRPAATPLNRQFNITFTPDDPHPQWNMFGTSEGNVADNTFAGTDGNIRPGVGGGVLAEALKQFARLKVTREPFKQYIRRRVQNRK